MWIHYKFQLTCSSLQLCFQPSPDKQTFLHIFISADKSSCVQQMHVIFVSVQRSLSRTQESCRKKNQRSSNTGYGGEASRTRGNLTKSKFHVEYQLLLCLSTQKHENLQECLSTSTVSEFSASEGCLAMPLARAGAAAVLVWWLECKIGNYFNRTIPTGKGKAGAVLASLMIEGWTCFGIVLLGINFYSPFPYNCSDCKKQSQTCPMVCCPGESSASLVFLSVWVSASLRGYVLRTTCDGMVDVLVDEDSEILVVWTISLIQLFFIVCKMR